MQTWRPDDYGHRLGATPDQGRPGDFEFGNLVSSPGVVRGLSLAFGSSAAREGLPNQQRNQRQPDHGFFNLFPNTPRSHQRRRGNLRDHGLFAASGIVSAFGGRR